ncbi:MAG: AraC family transcriptional regulator [Calothrix sp. MO_167.B42]|nr:AraC family transcriptional regulator [Calothrix sp. MO_167.B42]
MKPENAIKVNFQEKTASNLIFPNSPILSSNGSRWEGMVFEYHQQPTHDTNEHHFAMHVICIAMVKAVRERWLDGKFRQGLVNPGNIGIYPANTLHRTVWNAKEQLLNFMFVAIHPKLLHCVGQEIIEPNKIELIPYFQTIRDPLLYGIINACKKELETGGVSDRLYIESLRATLAIHLLKKYSAYKPIIREYTDGLSPYKLKQAIEYINAHIEENIKLVDIAQALDMSQFYFCRLFRQSMRISPYQYVIQQRIERAKQLLKQQRELSIANIALRCGFTDQSHLSKYFRRIVETTPKKFREGR